MNIKQVIFLLVILLFTFTPVEAADDCVDGEESLSINLLLTEHTVLYPLSQVCKPQLVDEFTAIKTFESWDFDISWSKEHHDLWHVDRYEVRVNDDAVYSFDYDEGLPVSIDDLAQPGVNEGLPVFEIRACSVVGVDTECGDWVSTETQCENYCTDNSYQVPQIIGLADTNSTGDIDVNWSAVTYPDYELQISVNGAAFQVAVDSQTNHHTFINQNNGVYAFQVRNRNGNIYSKFSPAATTEVDLETPVFNYLATENNTADYIVSWSEVSYENLGVIYQLEESANGGPWILISDNSSRSISFVNKPSGSNYEYRVRACRENNNCSDFAQQTISTVVSLDVPQIYNLDPITSTENYTVNWNLVSFDNETVDYELQTSINGGQWSTVLSDYAHSYEVVNHSVDDVYKFRLRACREGNNCSDYSNEYTVTHTSLPVVETFDVYEDTRSRSRFMHWGLTNGQSTTYLNTEYVRIRMYDQNENIIDQLHLGFDQNNTFYFNRDLTPFSYGLSLCAEGFCGDEVLDDNFEQGLSKVEDVKVDWNLTDPTNHKFKIKFSYPEDIFVNHGKPNYFEIQPMFSSGDESQDAITVNTGNNHLETWSTTELIRANIIGDDFSIRACRNDIGCGAPYYLLLSEPISSNDIPQPQLVINNGSTNDISVGTEFSLTWEFLDENGHEFSEEEINELVDYIEVIEEQPFGSTFAPMWWHPVNFTQKPIKYYTEDIHNPLRLQRLAKGYYKFSIKACKRDRINGDICSSSSDSSQYRWLLARNDRSEGISNKVENWGWYQIGDRKGIKWQFNSNFNKPDYFYLKAEHDTNARCIRYNDDGVVTETVTRLIVPYSEVSGSDFDLSNYCDDFKATNYSGAITGDATGEWRIQGCYNGVGCGGYETILNSNSSPEYNYLYHVDFSSSSIPAPTQQPDSETNTPIIGGPGDMKPGHWWNPDQSGTGWHFYWASELRYPSVHAKYGKTYDLLGFWMAYMEVDGIWTPTWFFSQMKQTQGDGIDDPQYFQGDLLYLTYNEVTERATPTHVGRLQTYFNGAGNQHVTIKLDVDFEGGVFSGVDLEDEYYLNQDEYEFQLEDISIWAIGAATPENNDDDHYSGAWWHYNQDGSLDEKITWLTWIENFLEVTTVLTYDTEGFPVWLQAHTCNPDISLDCNSAIPGAGYYDSYISPDTGTDRRTFMAVRNGFNPLGKTREGFSFDEELVFLGKGGRSFNSEDEYTQGGFWLNAIAPAGNAGLINRSVHLNYGTSKQDMRTFQKIASFHDIRFFINNQSESVDTCDYNNPEFSECQIKFTWFTDDDFLSIEPYYRYNNGTGWGDKKPLNDLCPGVPLNSYVVTEFVCDNFQDGGDYQFFLDKDSYIHSNSTVEIARSEVLTIIPCNASHCGNGTAPLAPADAPPIDNQMDLIAPDPLNDLVGVTAGAFDVNQSGGMNYTLPIYAPKGRGGLAPQLALSYDSSAGNGIAGQGWNISGASSITRCLRSREHDPGVDVLSAVSMTWDDVYCLDGTRLFKVSETETEVEYKTELANFSHIIGKKDPNVPNGPKQFFVYTKSGERWTYGAPGPSFKANVIFSSAENTGAQILASDGSGTVHTWLLAQINDYSEKVNRIRFAYDSYDGESYLSRVQWSNFGDGNSPHYQINFVYTDSRPDAMHHFGIGTDYKAWRSLSHVSTFIRTANTASAPLQEVRRLKLNYEEPRTANNPTGVLRLVSAEQCLDNSTCLKPVNFTWDDGDTEIGLSTSQFNGTKISKLEEMGYGSYKPIDINGDGIMEMIFIRGYDKGNWAVENLQAKYWIVADSSNISIQGSSCESLTATNENPHFDSICNTDIQPFHADRYDEFNSEKWFVYDFNGDGFQDILTPQRNGNEAFDYLKIFYSNGRQICLNDLGNCSAFKPYNTQIKQFHVKGGSSFLDYTGDGVPDLITFDEVDNGGQTIYKYKMYYSERIQRAGLELGYAPVLAGSEFIDINVDELEPIDMTCRYTGHNPGNYSCMNHPYTFEQVGRIKAGKIEQAGTDFNGDGYNDILYTYKYEYSSIESCQDHFELGEPQFFESSNDPLDDIPENEYTVDLISQDIDGEIVESFPSGANCEHQFKAIMLFGYNDQNQPVLNYAGRLGIINNYSDTNTGNNSEPENVVCQGDSLTPPNHGCGFRISESGGGVRVMDVNGDSLGDLVLFSTYGAIYHYLHTGKIETATMNNVAYTSGGSFEFNKVMFDSYQTIVPSFYSSNGTYGDGVCDTTDRTDFDDNACARTYLTQFIDYDLDGDLDALVPSLVTNSETTSYYQLYQYGLSNGNFGYTDAGNTGIEAWYAKKDLSKPRNDRLPQDYNNAFWDINGDGHYDYFSLLRKITQDEKKLKQVVQFSNNAWQTRNKITAIEYEVGGVNLESRIEISYDAATDPDSTIYQRSTGSMINLTDYGQGSPVFDILSPFYLVSQVSKTSPSQAGPNTKTSVTYAYEGMKIQGGGRGSLGFAAIVSIDTHHDVLTRTDYRQDFPFIGMPAMTQTNHNAGTLAESHNEYAQAIFNLPDGHQSVFPYLKRSYEKTNNLDVTGLRTAGNDYSIDGISDHKVIISDFIYNGADVLHGNLTNSEVRTCVGSVSRPLPSQLSSAVCKESSNQLIELKTTVNSYQDDETNWFLGRLSDSTVTSRRKVGNQYLQSTRQSSFTYYPETGQLETEVIHGDVDEYLMTVHDYDDYGQPIAKYQCSSHFDAQSCRTQPTWSVQQNQQMIQRYSITRYDEDEWNEYVEHEYTPYTFREDWFDHSDTNTMENNSQWNFEDWYILNLSLNVVEYDDIAQASRNIYGSPYRIFNRNGSTNRTVYGVFGDVHATANSTGGMTKITKRWCEGQALTTYRCPAQASTVIIEQSAGAPTSRKYYDVAGREVRAQVQNFNGQWQTTDTEYDLMGRTVKQSEPFTINDAGQLTSVRYWTETYFDPLDRVVKIVNPHHCVENTLGVGQNGDDIQNCLLKDVITTTSYDGLEVSTTNSEMQTTRQVFDETGLVIASYDAINNVVDYEYDENRNLRYTTSYLSGIPITIEMEYDALGRKISMSDPDKGDWQYFYNAAGELIEQRSANSGNSASVKNWYDIRGRLVYRWDADGGRSLWEYDDAITHKFGLLIAEHNRGDYQSHGVAQSKRYIYDSFGRGEQVLTTVYDEQDGTTPPVTTYVSKTVYDGVGRIFQQFDPIDDSFEDQQAGLQFIYNDYGYQSVIRDAENDMLGQEYYRVLNVDQRGQVIYERHHGAFETQRYYHPENGLLSQIISKDEQGNETQNLTFAFDRIGNLIRRTDYVINNGASQEPVTESFEYDDLNRLLSVNSDANRMDDLMVETASHSYDETGNLLTNSGLTLTYNHPTKPHAVSNVTGNGLNKDYQYDANGNVEQITESSEVSTFEYTSFDKVNKITAKGWVSEVYYNNARSRYIRKDINQGTFSRTVTHYLGNVEYKYTNDEVKIKRHIGGLIIESEEHENRRGRWTYHHLLKDHLGSTHTVVNRQGQSIQRFSFNAWGERRTPAVVSSSNVFDVIEIGSVWNELGYDIERYTNRGFTGHEHFDQVGIIHMNGRIYDPTIGRFLQADPIIQDPYSTQSLNRYSYVMNNPLSYTDPSGYSRLRKGWWRVPVAIAISIYTAGAASALLASAANAAAAGAAGVGFAGGAALTAASSVMATQALVTSVVGGVLAGAVSSGNLKGAVKGGIMAAVTFGIGHGMDGFGGLEGGAKVFAHSAVAGISAEVDGGKFGHGFASAILSMGADKIGLSNAETMGGRIVSNAVVAGTVSELTGGKFANGAMSAAFRVAFNEVLEGTISSGAKEDPDWFYGKKINGKMVDRYGDTGGRGMVLRNDGVWQSADGAAQEAAFGKRYNMDVDKSIEPGLGISYFLGIYGESKTVYNSNVEGCFRVVTCSQWGLGLLFSYNGTVTTTFTSVDSDGSGNSNGLFASGAILYGLKGAVNIGSGGNNNASASYSKSVGLGMATGYRSCTTSLSTRSGGSC